MQPRRLLAYPNLRVSVFDLSDLFARKFSYPYYECGRDATSNLNGEQKSFTWPQSFVTTYLTGNIISLRACARFLKLYAEHLRDVTYTDLIHLVLATFHRQKLPKFTNLRGKFTINKFVELRALE